MAGLRTDRIPADVARAVYGEDWTDMSTRTITLTSDAIPVLDEAAERLERGEGDGDSGDLYPVPEDMQTDYQPAQDLQEIAETLIEEHKSTLGYHTRGAAIRYAWKAKGGSSQERNTLGKCVKLSGASRYLGRADYLVWLAADHCADLKFTHHQIKALLFHELCHIQKAVTDQGDVVYKVRGHDAELFLAEYEHFGAWKFDLERVESTFGQQRLPGV